MLSSMLPGPEVVDITPVNPGRFGVAVAAQGRTDRILVAVAAMIEFYRSQLEADPHLEEVTVSVAVLPSGDVRGLELTRKSARRRARSSNKRLTGEADRV